MEDIKIGSILKFTGDEMAPKTHTREVMGICGKVVFTRELFDDSIKTPVGFDLTEDLVTWGWVIA